MTLKITMLGGNCPVQAEGTIDGKPFYFRARGEHWSLEIDGVLFKREQYGVSKFGAGWMSENEARLIIKRCADEYMAQKEQKP